jgi:sortase (surface protein transpeptidase)
MRAENVFSGSWPSAVAGVPETPCRRSPPRKRHWSRARSSRRVMVSAASNAVDHSSSILVSPRPGAENEEPGQPKMLAIPRLDLKMPITAVTVDDKGAMAIPDRPSEIGWYAYGPRPGSTRGSAVLGGHVDSREFGFGPPAGLKQLRRGDDIIIETNTGTERFQVSTVRLISKQSLDLRDVFKREGEPLLRILTCGGTYRRSGGYQANVVVTAGPA